ncbi:hypothetical protein PIB30_061366 [Stylosanthes scabra]|uniref:Putative plant transposon protein domain-containing protein n=1 Tax=Stylosanthes scabra TaxID=79078 RepID=A0ABU6UJL6_9FABA|nr:hypothetical protein [Stylosanthes scabra]
MPRRRSYPPPLPNPNLNDKFSHSFSLSIMASSLSTSNILDEHWYRTMFNQNMHEELVSKKKVTLEVTFDLDEDEYPSIKEQIALWGWRRLASPRTKVTKWMMHEFYANAVQSDEEMGQGDQHPYKSYVRGVVVDFSPKNIKRVLRFKDNTPEATTDYTTRLNSDQRLDEVLQDLCIPGATWRLSSGQPAQPIQLRRAELKPLARGWYEFIIHLIMPTGKKSEITIARAILIHSFISGEDVRVEEIIADNIAMIAQGIQGKSNLAFPSNIFKLCKDAGVSIRKFRGGKRIPQDKLITARLMETTRFGRNVQVQQHNEKGEEHNQGQHQHFQPQFHQDAGFQQHYMEQQQQGFTLLNEQLASMQI